MERMNGTTTTTLPGPRRSTGAAQQEQAASTTAEYDADGNGDAIGDGARTMRMATANSTAPDDISAGALAGEANQYSLSPSSSQRQQQQQSSSSVLRRGRIKQYVS
jgi:hypothetical protein